jgi:hypothetical protein
MEQVVFQTIIETCTANFRKILSQASRGAYNKEVKTNLFIIFMELTGIEPVTSWLSVKKGGSYVFKFVYNRLSLLHRVNAKELLGDQPQNFLKRSAVFASKPSFGAFI